MNNKYIKTNVEGFVLDSSTGAVLNVDNARLEAYRKQKQNAERANLANQRLDRVENDVKEIKEMLQQLLKR